MVFLSFNVSTMPPETNDTITLGKILTRAAEIAPIIFQKIEGPVYNMLKKAPDYMTLEQVKNHYQHAVK